MDQEIIRLENYIKAISPNESYLFDRKRYYSSKSSRILALRLAIVRIENPRSP